MTTTKLYSGLNDEKPTSRVLRPPGGASSNIFGDPEEHRAPPTNKPTQQDMMHGSGDERQGGGAAAAGSAPQTQNKAGPTQQEIYQSNRNRRQATEAPYARFGQNDRDVPYERNQASQNGEDYRSHSVTAYKNAVAQNAEIRQRARAPASNFNPITHEEGGPDNFNDPYARSHAHANDHGQAQAQAQDGFSVSRRGRGQERKPGAFNPITGEEYPDSGQKSDVVPAEVKTEDKPEDSPKTEDKPEDSPKTETPNTQPDTIPIPDINDTTPASTQDDGSPSKYRPSSKVSQPPGGASTPLW